MFSALIDLQCLGSISLGLADKKMRQNPEEQRVPCECGESARQRRGTFGGGSIREKTSRCVNSIHGWQSGHGGLTGVFFSEKMELTHSPLGFSSRCGSPRGSFVLEQQVAVEWQVNSRASSDTLFSQWPPAECFSPVNVRDCACLSDVPDRNSR